MCLANFIVIDHYLVVAQAGGCFTVTRNFGKKEHFACVCSKMYNKQNYAEISEIKTEATCQLVW